jgi:hypothetical protein
MEYSAPSQYHYHFLPNLGLRLHPEEGSRNFVHNEMPWESHTSHTYRILFVSQHAERQTLAVSSLRSYPGNVQQNLYLSNKFFATIRYNINKNSCLFNCRCNCICNVFIVCSVSFIVCVVLWAVFCLNVGCYFVWCVFECGVLCLIVVHCHRVKPICSLNNNNNNNNKIIIIIIIIIIGTASVV